MADWFLSAISGRFADSEVAQPTNDAATEAVHCELNSVSSREFLWEGPLGGGRREASPDGTEGQTLFRVSGLSIAKVAPIALKRTNCALFRCRDWMCSASSDKAGPEFATGLGERVDEFDPDPKRIECVWPRNVRIPVPPSNWRSLDCCASDALAEGVWN